MYHVFLMNREPFCSVEIKQRIVVDKAADRGAHIDQSLSLSIHMIDATTAKLSSMRLHSWQLGLKTGMYYL